MRILYALNSSQPGGMEQHVLDLVCGMLKNGHEVFVWCPNGVPQKWYVHAGAKVTSATPNFDFDPIYIGSLTLFLKKNKIDIVHAHEVKVVTNAILAAFLAGVGVRISHTHTPISEWGIPKIMRMATCFGYSFLVRFFCTKEVALTQSRKRIKMTEGIPEKKLVVIPNGVEVGKYVIDAITKESAKREVRLKYSIPADAFVFALLGRMSPEKGHLVALRAFTEFLKSNTVADKVYLLFAGGGVLEDVIRKEVSDLGLTTRVVVTGHFDKNDKIKLLSAFDVLLFPSTAEGFGIVMLEGMAFGVPVLCSNLEVLEEVGDGTVMFFEAGNHKNLADKMVGLYSKRDNLGTLIAGARTRVEELYSMERFIDSYNRLYQQLLEDIQ